MDFVFLNPVYDEGKKTRELSDLLIEDEESGIPIQLKFQDIEKALSKRDENKWAKKKLGTASKQVCGAIRNIERYAITTTHPYRGEINFPANYFKCKFGIVVIDYKSDAFVLESSLPRRSKNNIPIHYFSYKDFLTLCQKLMSLPDLIDYLEQRSFIPAWATPKFGDEKNAYAYYLTNKGKFPATLILSDFENRWEELTTKYADEFNEKEVEDENVFIYNDILKTFATKKPIAIGNIKSYIQQVTDIRDPNRINVTRILNKVRRIHRREISKRLTQKISKADNSELGFNYFAYKTDDPANIFVFIASRHDRAKRIEELTVMMDCVNNICNPKRVIGIATENKTTSDGRSYDVLSFEDLQPSDDKTDIENCKKFFGDFNFGRQYDFPSDRRNRFSI